MPSNNQSKSLFRVGDDKMLNSCLGAKFSISFGREKPIGCWTLDESDGDAFLLPAVSQLSSDFIVPSGKVLLMDW